jgi:hypothetical protein
MPMLQALAKQMTSTPAIAQLLAPAGVMRPPAGNPGDTGVFISLAGKQALRPYLVLHLVSAPPADGTLDGITGLIDGEIQIDAYGDDPVSARQLSKAVKAAFANYSGQLSDNTILQFTDVTMDVDEVYEQGGGGYLYRSLLRLQAFYTEVS